MDENIVFLKNACDFKHPSIALPPCFAEKGVPSVVRLINRNRTNLMDPEKCKGWCFPSPIYHTDGMAILGCSRDGNCILITGLMASSLHQMDRPF